MNTIRNLLLATCLLNLTSVGTAAALHVEPAESLSAVREKLAANAGITEVVFEGGEYRGSLFVSGPKGTDFSQRPLLIRAAEGASVLFDGSKAVVKFQPHEDLPGVFSMEYTHRDGEY